MAADNKDKVTIATLNRYKKEQKKAVFVSAYDYPQSILCNNAGVDGILVGDSMGMTTFGYENTLPVTMEQMLFHCEAVKKGNKNCFLIGDMPFMSYQESNEQAVRNAGRFLVSGMDAVKVEGAMVERIQAISKAGIIVMSHLGLTPQTRAKLGGYKVQGKTKDAADVILEQAKRMEDAGCSSILLEAVPKESAEYIKNNLSMPVYGIGAGDGLDGQLVIFHDLVGLFFEFKSKFVKRYCEAGKLIENALKDYADEVRNGIFPAKENFYDIKEEELEKLLADDKWKYVKQEKTPKEIILERNHPGC